MTVRIEGKVTDHINTMIRIYNGCEMPLYENIIILDNYDGTDYKKNKEKVGTILFSSQLISKPSIDVTKVLPTSSLNILTWKQLDGYEKALNISLTLTNMISCKSWINDNTNMPR